MGTVVHVWMKNPGRRICAAWGARSTSEGQITIVEAALESIETHLGQKLNGTEYDKLRRQIEQSTLYAIKEKRSAEQFLKVVVAIADYMKSGRARHSGGL